jgi:Protein of unknown function (DUF4238)
MAADTGDAMMVKTIIDANQWGMTKMKPRHHELPQYYLRDFCSPENLGNIWVFERNKPFKPEKRRGQYTPNLLGIRKQAGLHPKGYGEYESDLQKMENIADEAIRKVRASEPIGVSEKEIIARYIGLTWRRLAIRENALRPFLERRIREMKLRDVARQLANHGRFGSAHEMLRVSGLIESDTGKTDLVRKTILMSHEKVHALIMGRPWRFINAAVDHYFVTSDSPVVFDRSLGLQKSSLLFPIGRSVMLLISQAASSDLLYEVATPEETRKLNAVVIIQAHEKIYSPNPDEWIHKGWHDGFASYG